jgi:hypothetical protein
MAVLVCSMLYESCKDLWDISVVSSAAAARRGSHSRSPSPCVVSHLISCWHWTDVGTRAVLAVAFGFAWHPCWFPRMQPTQRCAWIAAIASCHADMTTGAGETKKETSHLLVPFVQRARLCFLLLEHSSLASSSALLMLGKRKGNGDFILVDLN